LGIRQRLRLSRVFINIFLRPGMEVCGAEISIRGRLTGTPEDLAALTHFAEDIRDVYPQ
jgi:hypothetical protein